MVQPILVHERLGVGAIIVWTILSGLAALGSYTSGTPHGPFLVLLGRPTTSPGCGEKPTYRRGRC